MTVPELALAVSLPLAVIAAEDIEKQGCGNPKVLDQALKDRGYSVRMFALGPPLKEIFVGPDLRAFIVVTVRGRSCIEDFVMGRMA